MAVKLGSNLLRAYTSIPLPPSLLLYGHSAIILFRPLHLLLDQSHPLPPCPPLNSYLSSSDEEVYQDTFEGTDLSSVEEKDKSVNESLICSEGNGESIWEEMCAGRVKEDSL